MGPSAAWGSGARERGRLARRRQPPGKAAAVARAAPHPAIRLFVELGHRLGAPEGVVLLGALRVVIGEAQRRPQPLGQGIGLVLRSRWRVPASSHAAHWPMCADGPQGRAALQNEWVQDAGNRPAVICAIDARRPFRYTPHDVEVHAALRRCPQYCCPVLRFFPAQRLIGARTGTQRTTTLVALSGPELGSTHPTRPPPKHPGGQTSDEACMEATKLAHAPSRASPPRLAQLVLLLVLVLALLLAQPYGLWRKHLGRSPASSSAHHQPRWSPPWAPMLTEVELRRGLDYYGSGVRMRQVAHKLLSGQPILVTVLGGSITAGAQRSWVNLLAQAVHARFPHRCVSLCCVVGWLHAQVLAGAPRLCPCQLACSACRG